jgi:hypothetical protein
MPLSCISATSEPIAASTVEAGRRARAGALGGPGADQLRKLARAFVVAQVRQRREGPALLRSARPRCPRPGTAPGERRRGSPACTARAGGRGRRSAVQRREGEHLADRIAAPAAAARGHRAAGGPSVAGGHPERGQLRGSSTAPDSSDRNRAAAAARRGHRRHSRRPRRRPPPRGHWPATSAARSWRPRRACARRAAAAARPRQAARGAAARPAPAPSSKCVAHSPRHSMRARQRQFSRARWTLGQRLQRRHRDRIHPGDHCIQLRIAPLAGQSLRMPPRVGAASTGRDRPSARP